MGSIALARGHSSRGRSVFPGEENLARFRRSPVRALARTPCPLAPPDALLRMPLPKRLKKWATHSSIALDNRKLTLVYTGDMVTL